MRGGDDGTRVGVALEDWTGEADGAGRPIAETRYLCVPYEALRGVPVSYAGLFEALSGLTPPFPPEGVQLRVAPLDPAVAADALGRFGVQRVAAAASLLIDGPVTITGAPELTAVDRLVFLDAVAALLPYGWRTRFSAATWDQSGNRNVSLAFARQVRDRTAELDWRTPRLPERDTPGRAYAEMLADLFGDRGRSHAEVVAHLAQATDPLVDTDPSAVVRVLGGLDWPATVLQAVERGTHDPADIRDLLTTGRHRELGDAAARKVLYALIRERAPEDVPLLRERWAEVAGTTVTPFRELCAAVRGLVWTGEDVPAGARAALALPYFQLAHDLGRADDLLAALVTAPKRDLDEVGAEAAALVVREAIGPAAVTATGPRWPLTLGELARSPRVVCALMTTVGRGEPAPLQAWYESLTHHLPASLLGLFRNLLFSPLTPLRGDQLAALAGHDTACVGDVLALAAEARRLPLVLDGLADWLASLDRIPAGDALLLKGRLARATTSDAASLGMLDGLLLWLAAPPHHVTGTATADHPAYWEGFQSVWTRPMPQGRADRRRETLTAWLRAGGWAAAGGTGPVLMLARRLMAAPPAEALPVAKAMLAARASVPSLGVAADYQVCRHEAEQLFPELAKDSFMTVLTNLPQNAPAGHIAALCAQEMARGVPAAQIAETLLTGLPNITAGTVVDVIGEVRLALTEMEEPDAANRALDLARAITRYPGVGPSLRTQAAAVAVAEIGFWHRIIEITAAADQDGELLIDESTREQLKHHADRAQSLLKASKPARLWRGGGGRS
ncbi:hypothetical protein [Actinomadura nitritigenes]|uniref:hypothetical protein n=1 Tax=Actinomadura nitritigenes TaxID=134602 RepID=UPI003D8C01D3